MGLKIANMKDWFYQWDTGQHLIVEEKCREIHFSQEGAKALVCQIKEENGKRVVDVPNILLQKAETITAYVVTENEEGAETVWAKSFRVLARPRPENYVYTQTEVLNFSTLVERLEKLEGEGISLAVEAYLKENPVQAGATAEEAEQIQQNKEDIEQLSQEKLDASKLPEAVNEALAQAKSSGDFKGDPGEKGDPGPAGAAGEDGYSIFYANADYTYEESTDGSITFNVFTIEKIFILDNGRDIQVGDLIVFKDLSLGRVSGFTGYGRFVEGNIEASLKGAKGDDYVLTEADKQEIAEQAAQLVEVPEGGTVTDEQIASAVEDYMAEHPVETDKTIDTVSNMIGLSGKYQSIDLAGFFEKIFKLKANADNKLVIPTPDGENEPTHPKVLYFPNGWNGHKYWMTFTPWTQQNNNTENPCICYSDDSETWSAEGIENPLAEPPKEDGTIVGYNSDSHIVMVGDVMECWWRTHYQSGSRAGWLTISRRTSTDGINWTEVEELHETNILTSNLSPVVIYEDGIYKIWLCHPPKLVYYESTDGTNWQQIRDINVNLTDKPDYKIWHFDIIHSEHGYEFVGCYNPSDTTKNLYIYYARSADNITYTTPYMVLTVGKAGQFDSGELYRPSIVRVGNGIMLYYGARLENSRTWGIGKVDATSPEALRDILIQSGEATAPDVTEYTITRNLTNVRSSNTVNMVEDGAAYSTVLSALSGYAIDSVTVKMGGVDITSTAYSGGTVSIGSVTGNVVITAVASVVTVVVPCTGISLNANTLSFADGTAQTLVATVEPSNTTDAIAWSVSPAGIVTVVNGVVTPVADGSCTVTATCGAQSASCAVTVSLPATVEPIAAYLASNPGSTENEWVDTKGGESITLNGGTFVDGAYQTDGEDDYAILPLNNAKTVKMRVYVPKSAYSVNNGTLFDCRTTATCYLILYHMKDFIGNGATYYVDDEVVNANNGSHGYFTEEGWYDVTVVFNNPFTGNMTIANRYTVNNAADASEIKVEYIKVYDVEVTP